MLAQKLRTDIENLVSNNVKAKLAGLALFARGKSLGSNPDKAKYWVQCNVCKTTVCVHLTGTIERTSLLGDTYDWIALDYPITHICHEHEATKLTHIYIVRNARTNVPYDVYSARNPEKHIWRTTPKISSPQGTALFSISPIGGILQDDIDKGLIHAS